MRIMILAFAAIFTQPGTPLVDMLSDCSHERPYQVVLYSDDEIICLGNLISRKNVLTCCQCLIVLSKQSDSARIFMDNPFTVRSEIFILAGSLCSPQTQQLRRSSTFAFEPNCHHKNDRWSNDAAIITLTPGFRMSPQIATIIQPYESYDSAILYSVLDIRNFAKDNCRIETFSHESNRTMRGIELSFKEKQCLYANDHNICSMGTSRISSLSSMKNLGSQLVCNSQVVAFLSDIRYDNKTTEYVMTFQMIAPLADFIWASIQPPGSIQLSNGSTYFKKIVERLLPVYVLLIHK